MSPEAQEFIALLNSSGMRDSQAADRLGVTRSAISQIRKGKSNPSRLMTRFLKEIVAREKPEALGPLTLRDSPEAGDLELWKRRAQAAERRFEQMREELRQLLDMSTGLTQESLTERAIRIRNKSLGRRRTVEGRHPKHDDTKV